MWERWRDAWRPHHAQQRMDPVSEYYLIFTDVHHIGTIVQLGDRSRSLGGPDGDRRGAGARDHNGALRRLDLVLLLALVQGAS